MPTCGKCNRALDDGGKMRNCCEGTYYCSRKCERANFGTHRLSCPKINQEPTTTHEKDKGKEAQQDEKDNNDEEHEKSEPGKKEKKTYPLEVEPLAKHIHNPFLRLKRGDYLQGRPDTDIYRLLNDAYFLRVADNRLHDRFDRNEETLPKPSAEEFRSFLEKAKAVPRMLPTWWSDKKQTECEELGQVKGWGRLAYTTPNPGGRGRREDLFMDIQLRLFAEYIYDTGIGEKKDCPLRQELLKLPDSFKNNEIGVALR
ncbi:hypothetical protein F5Y08DRAFT_313493 [Xylaria arbuscula]|nr:hypothetical protein F5Y08DRAFT_313493 [Xylaria arbuscula]